MSKSSQKIKYKKRFHTQTVSSASFIWCSQSSDI